MKVYLTPIQKGNFSRVKSVEEGGAECPIDFGPGYRMYFGTVGDIIIILLVGGTKKRQEKDIQKAKKLWSEYKQRKKEN